MTKPHIVVLGAGPAGLGAAYSLAKTGRATVTVLEQNDRVGGNAGSFELAGIPVDYGSHRLHPSSDEEVLADIRAMLGEDLLDRPRHGRINLRGRWIHFPLKPVDLALRLPPTFALGVARDTAGKLVRTNHRSSEDPSFASVMQAGLGETICRDFYFPYARKIWGMEPGDLSATQAFRRVRNNSLGKMVRKVMNAIPGLKPKGSGRFFYPRRGYGQISEAYCKAAAEAGAEIVLKARVKSVQIGTERHHLVEYERDGQPRQVWADYIWSTIPLTILARMVTPGPSPELLAAAQKIDFRAMILVYLVLEQGQFSEYDAHYFPGEDILITRLSEPKNYSARQEPLNRTVLCAELPCSPHDPVWGQSDEELGQIVCRSLETAGIPVRAPLSQVFVRRLRYAYPIYRQGYEQHFNQLDNWIGQIDGVLTFGRQGLFAHDNTHHALYMAYSAVKCIREDGSFDAQRWQDYRHVFETHVVED